MSKIKIGGASENAGVEIENVMEGLDIRPSSPKGWHYWNIQKVLRDLDNIPQVLRDMPIWAGAKRTSDFGSVKLEYVDLKTGGGASPYIPETLAEFCDVMEAIATGRVDYPAAALVEDVPEVGVILHTRALKRPKCEVVEQALKIKTYWDVTPDGDITQLYLAEDIPDFRFHLTGESNPQYDAGSCIGCCKFTVLTGNQSPEQDTYELNPTLEIREGGEALEAFIGMVPKRNPFLGAPVLDTEILNFQDQITKIIEYQFMHKYEFWPMSSRKISHLLEGLASRNESGEEYSPELIDQLMEYELGDYRGRSGQIEVTAIELDPRYPSPGYLFRRVKPLDLAGQVESIECPFLF